MDRLFRWQCTVYKSVLNRSRNESLYYRWCIDFSIGTDGQPHFTDSKLPLPSANYLFHQRILHIHQWRIHFSIGTNEQPCFTDGKLPLPSVPLVPMDKVFEGYLIHALGIMLTTCFTKGFYTFTDGVFISPSVRTDNLALPTVNCLYNRYHWYRSTRFSIATSCPWNNANYLFNQTILYIHRWCIHFSIDTDGQPRFTDSKLPLPSIPSVTMDKVFKGYLMPLE